jgi:hypothetical protein
MAFAKPMVSRRLTTASSSFYIIISDGESEFLKYWNTTDNSAKAKNVLIGAETLSKAFKEEKMVRLLLKKKQETIIASCNRLFFKEFYETN